jgi:hypothetical protein
LATLAVGLVVAACSSTSPPASPSSSTTGSGVTTTTATPGTLAQPPTSGPLSDIASVLTGFTSADSVLLTEAPDGSVYFACVSANCPGSSGSTQIWVVIGDRPPKVADQVAGNVMSLAASESELFVATNTAITAFNRGTGATLSTSPDPPGVTASGSFFPTVSLAFGAGQLWALYGVATDESGYEPSILERIDPANPVSPSAQVVSSDVGTAGLAAGESGAFFDDYLTSALTAVSSSGVALATSSALPAYPNQVTVQSEIGGALVALDLIATGSTPPSVVTYSPTTLVQASSSPIAGLTTGESAAIESTLAGPLLIVGGCNGLSGVADGATSVSSRCQRVTNLARISVTTGSTSDPVAIPSAAALLGPYPVVVTLGSAGIGLVRLG